MKTEKRKKAWMFLILGLVLVLAVWFTLEYGKSTERPSFRSPDAVSLPIDIRGRKLPLRIMSDHVSEVDERIIASDLSLCMSFPTRIVFEPLPENENTASNMDKVSRCLVSEKSNKPLFPWPLYDKPLVMETKADMSALLMSDALATEYRKAIAMRRKHIEAYKKLETFLSRLGNVEFIGAVKDDPKKMAEVFVFSPAFDQKIVEPIAEKILADLEDSELLRPSLLDFEETAHDGRQAIKAFPVIHFIRGEKENTAEKGIPYLLFLDGKWHLGVPYVHGAF